MRNPVWNRKNFVEFINNLPSHKLVGRRIHPLENPYAKYLESIGIESPFVSFVRTEYYDKHGNHRIKNHPRWLVCFLNDLIEEITDAEFVQARTVKRLLGIPVNLGGV